MDNQLNTKYNNFKNQIENDKGMVFIELIVILSIGLTLLFSFLKINKRIDQYRYQKFRTYHKKWKQMEVQYGANSQKYKIKDFIPVFNK